MIKKNRRKFAAEFKAKVILEALKKRRTFEELARKYELHPTQINTWKRVAIANTATAFDADKSEAITDNEQQTQ